MKTFDFPKHLKWCRST